MKVIAIHALWCIACLKTVPNLKEVLKKYPYELEELDYDIDIDKVEKYNVGTILPVFILEDETGTEVNRIKGEKSKKELEIFLESNQVKK